MTGLTFGNYLAVGRSHNFVTEAQGTTSEFSDVGAYHQFVVIISWGFVATIGLCHHKKSVVVLLHIAVRESSRPTKLGSTNFEPDKIVCIIDDSHLISFRITYTQKAFVPFTGNFSRRRTC